VRITCFARALKQGLKLIDIFIDPKILRAIDPPLQRSSRRGTGDLTKQNRQQQKAFQHFRTLLRPFSLVRPCYQFSCASARLHFKASAHDKILRCRINAAFRRLPERRIYAAAGTSEENLSCTLKARAFAFSLSYHG
jgi:hypothetical protein